MKRFIFYLFVYLLTIAGILFFMLEVKNWTFDYLFNMIKTDLRFQIGFGFLAYYLIALLANIIITSVRMSRKCVFSFYGRPIEFHGDTINNYDYGRITFRTKKGDLEAYQIYTTRSLSLPTHQCFFNVGISKHGTVKVMFEVDNDKCKVGPEYVKNQNIISSILMLYLISILPIAGIILVVVKTNPMK